MRKLTTLIILMLLPLGSFANPQNMDETDELIIFHIYNGGRPIADSLLDMQIKLHPDNPKYYLLKCQNYFYSRYFNQGNLGGDSLMQLVHQSAQKAIEIGEKETMTINNKFYVGSAYGYLARYSGRMREYWDAYEAAQKAQAYLNDVLQEDPSFIDAKQELAIQTYFIGTRGIYLQFLAWLVDISSSREEALQQFHEVADNGRINKTEAQFVLFALYRFIENDPEQANVVGNTFLEAYPNNGFVANQIAQLEFLVMVERNGIDFLETEFDSLASKYGVTNPNILNLLGYNLINQGRSDEAVRVLKTNLRLYPELANSYDSLSEAYELNGDTELAIKYAKLCLEKLPFDSTITENFRELVKESSENRLEALGVDMGKVNI